MAVNIDSTAKVSPLAELGRNVTIGAFTIVNCDVILGDDTVIDSHCVIGAPTPLSDAPLRIGNGARIRSHSIFYCGAVIGDALVTGHNVIVRERSLIGRGVQIGTNSELQGDLVFGDYTRTQSSVFVPKHCKIGSFVWLLPGVCLTNDPHPPSDPGDLGVIIEDFAVVSARSTALPGVRIGARSVVAAQSLVTRDVPPDMLVAGSPARVRGPASDVRRRDNGLPAYPWTTHFTRGYPREIAAHWQVVRSVDSSSV